ncbi:hypothetical protein ABN763_14770 [Spongiivirga sp. MCCC 1A20706]|uniref:hypothetical protein n=1 Tax=Spongiivirga sp. MCCC 1A20706 TaxID=3160963 RepID=UPI003977B3C1
MKKKIGYVLLTILGIILVTSYIGIRKFNNTLFKEKPNYLEYSYESKPIQFNWVNDSIGDYYEAQAAIVIPLKIKGLAHNFYAQFDTGSPHSYIYENDLKSLRKLGLKFTEVVKEEAHYIEQLNFNLNGNRIEASMIKILKGYGNTFDKRDTITNIKIGTIGSDFVANRITAIDFKNQTIQLFDERPEWMGDLGVFKAFDFTARRIMMPVTLDKKEYEFLYDSGCSAFGLITIKSRFDAYTNKNIEAIQYGANSWGNSIPIISKPSDKTFGIGNTHLTLRRVSYVNMYTAIQPLVTPFTRIGGWLGNQPFNESTLILDTKKQEFFIIK